jgi:hypothetical protein
MVVIHQVSQQKTGPGIAGLWKRHQKDVVGPTLVTPQRRFSFERILCRATQLAEH